MPTGSVKPAYGALTFGVASLALTQEGACGCPQLVSSFGGVEKL